MNTDHCVHDYLNPGTTIVVQPQHLLCWCVACGAKRSLAVLSVPARHMALAARDHMLFLGATKHDGN